MDNQQMNTGSTSLTTTTNWNLIDMSFSKKIAKERKDNRAGKDIGKLAILWGILI